MQKLPTDEILLRAKLAKANFVFIYFSKLWAQLHCVLFTHSFAKAEAVNMRKQPLHALRISTLKKKKDPLN